MFSEISKEEGTRSLELARAGVNPHRETPTRHRTSFVARRVPGFARRLTIYSLALGLLSGVVGSSLAPESSAAATSKDKVLFVAVSNSYNAAVTEFNVAIESFSACPSASCVAGAIEGAGDTRFYKATVALEKKGPFPSGVSKNVDEYIGNLIAIQKDINAVAKAKTIAVQKAITSGKLEIDVDNLAFRGMQILIYLGEQKKF
jgi:hypothetical protein